MPLLTVAIRLALLAIFTSTLAGDAVDAAPQERTPDGRAHNPGLPGWCETPAADRKAELGCYTTAIADVGRLPASPIYWHLDTFPTRAAADASRGPRGTVVDSQHKVWLFTIAELMAIASLGPDVRRTVFLVLHRSSHPYVMREAMTPDAPHAHWQPAGACPR